MEQSVFHVKDHGMSMEGFRMRVTYILEKIIVCFLENYCRQAREEAGRTATQGRKGNIWVKGRGAIKSGTFGGRAKSTH